MVSNVSLMSGIRKRSIHIHGHKTSISLEDEFWRALKEIAALRNARVPDLLNMIADQRPEDSNLSSAVRLHVLRHFRALTGQPNQLEDRRERTEGEAA